MLPNLRKKLFALLSSLSASSVFFIVAPHSQNAPYIVFNFLDISSPRDTVSTHYVIDITINLYGLDLSVLEALSVSLLSNFDPLPDDLIDLSDEFTVFGISNRPERIIKNLEMYSINHKFQFFIQPK